MLSVRSSARPRGLPAALLTPDQKKVVKYSNRISKNAFVLMNKLAEGGVPHCFEQPVGSLLMKDLDFKSWASRWGGAAGCHRSVPVRPAIQEADGDLGCPVWLAGWLGKDLPRGPCAHSYFEWLGEQGPQPAHEPGFVCLPGAAVCRVEGHHAQEPR